MIGDRIITPLKVLLIEDSEFDTELILIHLKKDGFDPQFEQVETAHDLRAALQRQTWDIIISDYNLPGFSGPEALAICQSLQPETPLIVASGTISEETAISMMRAGAADYLMKDRLMRLGSLVRRELNIARVQRERKESQAALIEMEARYKLLFEQSPVGVVLIDPATLRFIDFNQLAHQQLGYSREEFAQLTVSDIELVESRADSEAHAQRVLEGTWEHFETMHRTRGGETRHVQVSLQAVYLGGRRLIHGVFLDITARKQAEQALRESESRMRGIINATPSLISQVDLDGRVLFINRTAFLVPPEKMTGSVAFEHMPQAEQEKLKAALERVKTSQQPDFYESQVTRPDGVQLWYENHVAPVIENGIVTSIIINSLNVTEQRHQQDELHKKEERLRQATQIAGLGIWEWDLTNDRLIVEGATLEIYGITANSFSGRGSEYFNFTHPDDRQMLDSAIKRASLAGITEAELLAGTEVEPAPMELRIIRPDGAIVYILADAICIVDENRQPLRLLGVMMDITRQKQAELALRESEHRLQTLVNAAPIIISQIDPQGRLQMINQPIHNLEPLRLIGASVFDTLSPPDQEQLKAVMTEAAQSGSEQVYESTAVRSDGSRIYFENHVAPLVEDGAVKAFIIFSIDITKRKRLQEEQRQQEERLKLAVCIARLGIWEWDLRTDALTMQGAMAEIHSLPQGASGIAGSSYKLVTHPEDHAALEQRLQSSIASSLTEAELAAGKETRTDPIELRIWREDGSEGVILTDQLAILDEARQPLRLLGVSMDITALKKAQQSLQESEAMFRQMVERSNDIFYRQSVPDRQFNYISPKVTDILGYTPEEMTALDIEAQTAMIHPDDLPWLSHFMDDLLAADEQGLGSLTREFRMRHKDGSYRWIRGNYALVRSADGQPELVVGSLRDITNRMKALSELERWGSVFERAAWGIALGASDGQTIELVNPAFARLHGYSPDEMRGMVIADLFSPEYRQDLAANLQIASERGQHLWESVHLRKDGSAFPVLIDVTVVKDETGQLNYRIVYLQDISAQKKVEEILHKKNHQHLAMVQHISDVVAMIDAEGKVLYQSPNVEKWFGWQPGELVGTHFTQTIHPEDLEQVQREFTALRDQINATKLVEFRFLCKDGRFKTIELSAVNLLNDPAINGILMNYHDISERKQAEQALIKSEQKFSTAFRTSPDAIYISRLSDGTFIEVNDGFTALSGFSREEALGKTSIELKIWRKEEDRERLVQQLREKGESLNQELLLRVKDGSLRTFQSSSRVIEIGGEMCILTVSRDITEQKLAQQKINEQIDELRRWHAITLGREQRVMELKEEVNQLLAASGRPPRYTSQSEGS